ncbi:MAG: hypothetical protein AVDCRST_MAG52-1147, partial [uncultured Blastococcus sp.]
GRGARRSARSWHDQRSAVHPILRAPVHRPPVQRAARRRTAPAAGPAPAPSQRHRSHDRWRQRRPGRVQRHRPRPLAGRLRRADARRGRRGRDLPAPVGPHAVGTAASGRAAQPAGAAGRAHPRPPLRRPGDVLAGL